MMFCFVLFLLIIIYLVKQSVVDKRMEKRERTENIWSPKYTESEVYMLPT